MFSLRPALPDDAPTLATFGARTFRDTFAPHNRADDVEAYVALAYGVAQQSDELSDPHVTCILAETGDTIVGYVLLRHGAVEEAPACVGRDAPVELARLYVDAEWQGRGVAAALMAAAVEAARGRGGRTLWLGVWEHNPRARAFYARQGFREVGEHPFLLGADRQRDLLLVRAI